MSPDATHALVIASRELRAARAIALDPSCDGSSAAAHLAIAWQALALATWPEGQVPDPPAPRPEDRAALPARLARAIDDVLPAVLAERGHPPLARSHWSISPTALERHCDALARILARHHRPPIGRRSPWWGRGAAIVALALLTVVALRPWQSEGFGPWRATYYNRVDFTGQTEQRRDLDVRFDWGVDSPMDSIPKDRFSVRWDTCLTVPSARSVAFQLVSDEGSRLFIDGALVVDNWGRHVVQAHGETLELTAGEHHLRVEYFEEKGQASIALLASLDGEVPDAIPRAMLRAPEESDDDDDPCGE